MLLPRKAMERIKPFMDSREIIVIHGARQVGKTSLMRLLMDDLAPDEYFYMDLEEPRYLELCEQGYEGVVEYLKLRGLPVDKHVWLFIDEIQYLKDPSNFLKLIHDHRPEIKMVVSGSSWFNIRKKFRDSLTGRTIDIDLYPLDFQEFLWFKGRKYDLARKISNPATLRELNALYLEYAKYGGFPAVVLSPTIAEKETRIQQIINTYIRKDIRDLGRIRAIDKFNKLVRVLAAQGGSLLNVSEVAGMVSLSRQVVEDYLFILENTFVIKLLRPFSRNLRSELFKRPKVFFLDTGIMNMLKNLCLPQVMEGEILETAVFSDLVKNIWNHELHFWRTRDGKEIDFVVEKDHLIPIEVKLNAHNLNPRSLLYFKRQYAISHLYCIAMEGKIRRGRDQVIQVFPWDVYRILAGKEI